MECPFLSQKRRTNSYSVAKTSRMSVELVANDGSRNVLAPFPSTKQVQTVRIMLGPTVVEIKTTHGNEVSTSLDVLHRQHQDPKLEEAEKREAAKREAAKKLQSENDEWVKEMRGWLMILASLFASMAFQAGLNPPAPTTNTLRIDFFLWLNSAAFVCSLCMVMLLLSERIFYSKHGLKLLRGLIIADTFVLAGAFAAGCARGLAQTLCPIAAMFVALFGCAYQVWRSIASSSDSESAYQVWRSMRERTRASSSDWESAYQVDLESTTIDAAKDFPMDRCHGHNSQEGKLAA